MGEAALPRLAVFRVTFGAGRMPAPVFRPRIGSVSDLAPPFTRRVRVYVVMTRTIELSDDLAERLEDHLQEDETMEELIEELVNIYEQEGRFTDKGL